LLDKLHQPRRTYEGPPCSYHRLGYTRNTLYNRTPWQSSSPRSRPKHPRLGRPGLFSKYIQSRLTFPDFSCTARIRRRRRSGKPPKGCCNQQAAWVQEARRKPIGLTASSSPLASYCCRRCCRPSIVLSIRSREGDIDDVQKAALSSDFLMNVSPVKLPSPSFSGHGFKAGCTYAVEPLGPSKDSLPGMSKPRSGRPPQ
jgi:hypothetical protein